MGEPLIRRQVELRAGDESPLAFVVAEDARNALGMVRDALAARRMRLAYQPVVLSSDPTRPAFHEALIRILDPKGRIIPARDFIGAAESHASGREVDCAALDMALTALARHPRLRLSVNMSARSIGYPRWSRILRRALADCAGIGERLILEITESSAMQMPEIVVAFMADLREQGISFALDDFGAGQTSLRYFRDFQFDILKIDGQFIRGVDGDPDNQVLTAACLSIARHFDMVTVAESVETAAEAAWLTALGVECLQGFHFGAPTVSPAWEEEAVAAAIRTSA